MACCGLCLGALRFRLQCVLLHEGGLWIMKWLLFRWGAASLHALRPALLPLLLTSFPRSLASTPSRTYASSGGGKVFMVSHFFRHSSSGGGGLFGESERHQRRQPWVALTVVWSVSGVDVFHTSRGRPASLDISQIIPPSCWGLGSNSTMDVLALEAKSVNGAEADKKSAPRPKPKPPKKAKRIVYFEVEIVDLKTKEKLLLLDKVSVCVCVCVLCVEWQVSDYSHLLYWP